MCGSLLLILYLPSNIIDAKIILRNLDLLFEDNKNKIQDLWNG